MCLDLKDWPCSRPFEQTVTSWPQQQCMHATFKRPFTLISNDGWRRQWICTVHKLTSHGTALRRADWWLTDFTVDFFDLRHAENVQHAAHIRDISYRAALSVTSLVTAETHARVYRLAFLSHFCVLSETFRWRRTTYEATYNGGLHSGRLYDVYTKLLFYYRCICASQHLHPRLVTLKDKSCSWTSWSDCQSGKASGCRINLPADNQWSDLRLYLYTVRSGRVVKYRIATGVYPISVG